MTHPRQNPFTAFRHASWRRQLLLLLLAAATLALAGGLWAAGNHPSAPSQSMAAPPPRPLEETPAASSGRDLAEQLSEAFEHASDVISPSVVAIFAEHTAPQQGAMSFDPFQQLFGDPAFRQFFGTPRGQRPQSEPEPVRAMGSGVIVSKDGYVLTNNHLVGGADKLWVVIGDDERIPAHVVGTDPPTDVAVIQIDFDQAEHGKTGHAKMGELPVATLGDSDHLRVGQWVVAVGNPFELLHTVTAGIISARGRSSVGLADYEDFIQTDASVNPGNSGGALADLDGRVVGINTAISSPSGGSVGIGFAIPINMARQVMSQLIEKGEVNRGYLALVPQDLDENLVAALGLDSDHGALVSEVTQDGPADRAGVERGDVVVAFDNRPVKDALELRRRVAAAKPGSKAELTVLRKDKEKRLEVELGERPKSDDEDRGAQPNERRGETLPKLGLDLRTLTPDIERQLGLDGVEGAVVARVAPGSLAEDAGLRPRDVIVEINGQKVTSAETVEHTLGGLSSGQSVAFLVRRGQVTFYAGLRLP